MRLAKANLETKTVFDNKLIKLNRNANKSNKTEYVLVENKFKKLQRFDLNYFPAESDFEDDGDQNYLVFQRIDSKGLLVVAVVNTSIFRSLKFYLMKD